MKPAATQVAFRYSLQYNPVSAAFKVVALGTCPLESCESHAIGGEKKPFERMGVLDDMCVLRLACCNPILLHYATYKPCSPAQRVFEGKEGAQ